jgi:hypothetical protein
MHLPRLDLARAGGGQASTQRYQRGRSRAFRRTFALVIVGLIVVDHSKEGDDILLLSAPDILIERSRNRFLLRTVMSQFPGFLDKPVVDGKVRRHSTVSDLTLHNPMCNHNEILMCRISTS